MEQSLYLECSAGVSGDMLVAALLDAGASQEELMRVLDNLPIQGFSIEITRVKKSGLDACDFNVVLDAEHDGRDHDMEYLYGHLDTAVNEVAAAENVEHEHAHVHGTEHIHTCVTEREHVAERAAEHSRAHAHSHEHRGLPEILNIIEASCATQGAKTIARRTFEILAQAEAKAHGVPVEEVHFHEVGAVDSIVDIIAASVCLDNLAPQNVYVPKLCEGQGSVRCQHGILPVPVPAVANIAQACGIPLSIINVQGELVTPTGAAFAAAVRTKAQLPKAFTIKRTGLGAGKRTYPETSGLLRAFMIES
jgi:pyridinium-3,5-bisthiocarboxylic acid mononucleotide nickel chelatase